jgi:hypothetical protein
MLVHVVADYGPAGDLAFAEVVQRLRLHLPDAEPVPTPVPPFATLAAGFCVAQLGLNEAPAGTLVYHNVAPRQDEDGPREANAGERLAFARLPTGVRVIGVNAGHAFSFVRDAAEELRWAAAPAGGSQFRSRDLFPAAAAAIALGRPDALGEAIGPEDVPGVPAGAVAYVDGYGNLKTTLRAGDLPGGGGAAVRVRIGGRGARGGGGRGHVRGPARAGGAGAGEQRVAGAGGEEVRWLEVFLRGGSAWEAFGRPGIGDRVEVEAAG